MAARRAVILLVAATLAFPASAEAKQVEQVKLCGATRCFTFDRGNSGGKLAFFDQTGAPAPAPARGAPWYRLRITVGGARTERFTYTNAYVPSADRIRRRAEGGGYEWVTVVADLRPVLRNVAARLEPLPGARTRAETESLAPASYWVAAALAAAVALMLVARRRARG